MPFDVVPGLSLPDDVFTERFVRSSGPGGQNVNKVATAVELRFDIGRAPLAADVKSRLRALAHGRVIEGDILLLDAREHRTQAQNREAARERLAGLIRQALVRPKARRKTRPTLAARTRRLEGKIKRAAIKRGRSRGRDDE